MPQLYESSRCRPSWSEWSAPGSCSSGAPLAALPRSCCCCSCSSSVSSRLEPSYDRCSSLSLSSELSSLPLSDSRGAASIHSHSPAPGKPSRAAHHHHTGEPVSLVPISPVDSSFKDCSSICAGDLQYNASCSELQSPACVHDCYVPDLCRESVESCNCCDSKCAQISSSGRRQENSLKVNWVVCGMGGEVRGYIIGTKCAPET